MTFAFTTFVPEGGEFVQSAASAGNENSAVACPNIDDITALFLEPGEDEDVRLDRKFENIPVLLQIHRGRNSQDDAAALVCSEGRFIRQSRTPSCNQNAIPDGDCMADFTGHGLSLSISPPADPKTPIFDSSECLVFIGFPLDIVDSLNMFSKNFTKKRLLPPL